MVTSISYDFCKIDIYQEYIAVTMFEGINLTPEHNSVLLSISKKYFKDRSFGYITCRKYSYSVNPRIYIETSKIKNLAAFAIVSSKDIDKSNAEVEKLFFKKPFMHFTEIEEAIVWIKKEVSRYNQS